MSKKTKETLNKQVDNNTIKQHSLDGYLNATLICEMEKKNVEEYLNSEDTKRFLKELTTKTNLPLSTYIRRVTDEQNKESVWVHPSIALNIGKWFGLNFHPQVLDWIYQWMLENDFDSGVNANKEVPKDFEEKIKKSLRIQS
ncbi:KilA-N domain-containing protein [Dysgonomonas sp. 216]|uniref:KilA-N domain-containing protein n=1 Tax=Dysgonomonas sp. 216 TaxID=2302934 RepID=UPI0013D14BD5|nr:KilA-N domain-containing protein [Dysgonomonas sp. 216]NDW18102.1 KilA-N domain-containing protein [Dysgonomonas sp. 216]